jgi:universal stress protein A
MTTHKNGSRHLRNRRPNGILVPIDFSESSINALRHAARLIRAPRKPLTIVHVVPADYGWLGIGQETGRDLDEASQRQAAKHLQTLAKRILPRRVNATLEVRIGRPAEEIIAAATEAKSELIVMSTHGRGVVDRLLIGSVADRVARLAPCPVLLMRPGSTTSDRKPRPPAVLRFRHNDNGHLGRKKIVPRTSLRGADSFEVKGDRNYESG